MRLVFMLGRVFLGDGCGRGCVGDCSVESARPELDTYYVELLLLLLLIVGLKQQSS